MQQPQHAMGARHLCAGQRGRQERGGKRRQVLVLHHRRLRLRPFAGSRHGQGGAGAGRHGCRQRAKLQGAGRGAGQRRPGHGQCGQAGARIRHRGRRAAPGVALDLPVGPACAGSGKCARPVLRGRLLLGLRRCVAPMVVAFREGLPRPEAHDDAGRRVFQRAALPAFGGGGRQHRWQGGGGQDA
ncbi:hypothetical protein G6F50_015722 [Rhizopus delemar]|uniref:Uncharacterized protein n=1 Tax=Rhizopus delemar TaxID=936053 RepID=A0A9P6XWH4_9FUNG|nr:hypothetical protein G6F50_015722 [Rhizopus delemar]